MDPFGLDYSGIGGDDNDDVVAPGCVELALELLAF